MTATTVQSEVPWTAPADLVAAGFGCPPGTGLDPAEAARRLSSHGPNVITQERPVSLLRSVAGQLRSTMILVLLAAGALTLVTGDVADAAVIFLVVVVNTVVGTIQERRALGAVQALQDLAAPLATVRRGGVTISLPAADVVPGDLLVLAEGDVVAADARLLSASSLEVDEALLTGESLPSARDPQALAEAAAPLADRRCMVHGGTLVQHGHGLGVVVETGEHSQIGTVSALLSSARTPLTPLQRRLDRLGRTLSLVAVVGCAAVAVLGLWQGQPRELVLVTAISLAVAAIPESLPAVVALALAGGGRRMARHGAIVRTLGAVETLGSVTVLASDKTGTLTTGEMEAVATWTPEAGEQVIASAAPGPDLIDVLAGAGRGQAVLLVAAVLCNDADSAATSGGLTELALVRAAIRAGIRIDAVRQSFPRVGETPFDHAARRMSTTHRGRDGDFVLVKGAPEAILTSPAAGADHRAALELASRWAADGRRVIAVCGDRRESGETVSQPRLLGLIAIADPVRPDAAAAVQALRGAGVTTVLITGDHPGTAEAVARQTGIIDPAADDSGVQPRVSARADPPTKLHLIGEWQRAGHVVAMTGDGVNDAPALRVADIGVAMGRRGTDVARAAADLVLTDDSLATIVTAVAEGRRVFDNIRRFVRYGLAGGAAEIAVMLIGPALGFDLPLLAGQILWVNLLTHGLPGVAMGAEQAEPDVLTRRPRRPGEPILTRDLIAQILVLGSVLTAASLGAAAWTRAAGGPWQSVLFAVLAAGQLTTALTMRSQRQPFWRIPVRANPMLLGAVVLSAALLLAALYLPPLQEMLRTAAPGPGDLLAVLIGAAVPGLVGAFLIRARPKH
jgi:Ca2+-transporting ATPase